MNAERRSGTGRRETDCDPAQIARALDDHLRDSDDRFRDIQAKLQLLEETERRHDSMLMEIHEWVQQLTGGWKVLRLIGWLLAGGVITTAAAAFRKLGA